MSDGNQLPAGAKPAPGTNPNMPTPKATPGAPAPVPQQQQQPVSHPGGPQPVTDPGSGNPHSPVSAAAAASAANQAQQAAAAQAQQPVVAEPAAEPKAPATVDPTGNKVFDEVAAVLTEKGVADVSGILKQAASGDLSLLAKAELVEKLGEGMAGLVISQLTSEMSAQKGAADAESTRIKEFAATAFGESKEDADAAWGAIQNFAASADSGLSHEERVTLNNMLKAGGVQAELAVKDLASRYRSSQGFTQEPDLIQGDRSTQSGFQPLLKAEYQNLMRKAQREHGEGSAEVEALRRRRTASIQRGFVN